MAEKKFASGNVVKSKIHFNVGATQAIKMTVIGETFIPQNFPKGEYVLCRYYHEGKFHTETFNVNELELLAN